MDNVAATALAAILGIADPGAATSTQVLIALSGDAERKTVAYECEGVTPFKVEYINAGQNFLAVVPVNGFSVVFVNVLAASGARYVVGPVRVVDQGHRCDLHRCHRRSPPRSPAWSGSRRPRTNRG